MACHSSQPNDYVIIHCFHLKIYLFAFVSLDTFKCINILIFVVLQGPVLVCTFVRTCGASTGPPGFNSSGPHKILICHWQPNNSKQYRNHSAGRYRSTKSNQIRHSEPSTEEPSRPCLDT